RFGSLRFRHGLFEASREQSHASVAVSPDGQFLATCTSDSVQLWNPLTGERVTKLDLDNEGIDHPISITGNQELAFSADGTCLAISRGAGKLRILANMGRSSKEFEFGSPDHNRRLGNAFSFMGPDMVAMGGGRGFAGPSSSLVAFLPDGKQVLVSHFNAPLLRLLSVESGTEIRTFGSNDEPPSAVDLSPDGQWLALAKGTDGRVTVFDVATGTQHLQLTDDSGPCTSLAFSPDSKVIATASADIHLWDAASGKRLRSLDSARKLPPEAIKVNNGQAARRNGSAVVLALHFSPDGKQVLAGYRTWVGLWDAVSGKEIRHFVDLYAPTVRFMPNGKELLIVAPGVFRFYDVASGKPIRLYEGHQSAIRSIAFAPDGKQLATGTGNEGVRIWETASRKAVLASDKQIGEVTNLAYSPRGDALVGALGSDIAVWDARTGAQRLRLAAHLEGRLQRSPDLAISSDGGKLAYATSFGWACQVNLTDGTELQDLHLRNGPTGTIAFSPDLHLVAAPPSQMGGQMPREAPLGIWDFQARKELKSITTPFGPSTQLTFSPDGRTLIDVTNVRTREGIKIYALEILSGQQRFSILEAGSGPLWGQVSAVAFSPDGRRIAFAENLSSAPVMARQASKEQARQSIRVLDLPTGRWASPLSGHEGDINALAFSPDGKLLASGSSDTTALLWNVEELFPPAPAAPLSADARMACWNDLGGEAKTAYRSMWKLAGDPNSIDLFRKELKSVTATESNEISQLRTMRAIEVLEWMNTKAARELLGTLAGGLSSSPLPQEAMRSLARLKATAGAPE
ncbi:MAG TPA: WD40 repeat domain-containing protein, partial [Gemmataceae bacterium]|nr:WD40 repeat domain-containing protein [Gemmataceae bacterium]